MGTPGLSNAGTPAPPSAPFPAPTPIPTPIPIPAPGKYTDEDFHKFMKVYMESVQGQNQAGPQERRLKAWFLDLYYGKSQMGCYSFCQRCEDYFETAGATGSNRILFAALFLQGNISFHLTQHKRRHQGEGAVPITWVELKPFF